MAAFMFFKPYNQFKKYMKKSIFNGVINQASLSLCFSLIALGLSLLSYFGPKNDAKQRLSPQIAAMNYYNFSMDFAGNQKFNPETCETSIELVEIAFEDANKALESERHYLSGTDYKKFYAQIYGPLVAAKKWKFKLEYPDSPYPEIIVD